MKNKTHTEIKKLRVKDKFPYIGMIMELQRFKKLLNPRHSNKLFHLVGVR